MKMKRKKFILIVPLVFSLALLCAYPGGAQPLITITKVTVQSGELNTYVILTSSGPIVISDTFYSLDHPATMVILLERFNTGVEAEVDLQETLFVQDIKIEKTGATTGRLLISLREKVPYRFYYSQGQTVIELNRIQRSLDGYIMTSETETKLRQIPKKNIYFRGVAISESEERIRVTAKLSDDAVSQVFALESPLRLVVDFFDTLYPDPTYVYPVQRLGIYRVRTGQFQRTSPYTIARLVFDLQEPRFYNLQRDTAEVDVSFTKEAVVRPVPEIAVPVPEVVPEIAPPAVVEPVPVEPVRPLPPVEEAPREVRFEPRTIARVEERYTGEIISLRFKDADLRDVILYLADFADLNVVFDPDVRGTVTCDLRYVPWDQALDIILKQNRMGRTIEGNVLRIASIGALTREEEEQRKLRESLELVGPQIHRTFELSYSRAADVQRLLVDKLSTRGEMITDERTNTLIISDVKDRINLIEQLIAVFDTPTPQVSIEARIVEATSNFVRNLGIQWGFRGIMDPFYGNQTSLQFPNKILADGALIPQGIVTKGIGGPLGGYAINLPAPAFNTALGLSFGNVMDTIRIDMAISALETSGQGRIISCPSITTQNNKQAEIVQGRQIPVQTVANFTTSTRFVNAALELRVTPQITAEGTIIMNIEIRNNAADFANLVNGIPPITTQSADTTVMVPDGGTAVIGGIYRTEDSITRERVPLLHQIPILGSLFKNFARTRQNRELLIFITPRIIQS